MEYPNIPFAMKPLPHRDIPTHLLPTNWNKVSILNNEEEVCIEGL
jgi:hypothetical protein